MSAGAYAVLLREPAAPSVLGRSLARIEGSPLADAALRARAARGIILEGTEKARADACARALEEDGVAAMAIPTKLLEDPPAEETIRAATLSPAGLQAEGKPLPWEGLAALCAGAVSRPRGEPELILELAWLEPRRRLRVDAPRFDYSCLNARMGYGSAANLRRLAAELSRRAPRALLGQGLRAILDGAPGRERAYGSRAELERELRWLLTLRALERA